MLQHTFATISNTALDNIVVVNNDRFILSDKVAETIAKAIDKALKDGEAVLQPIAPVQASVKPEVAEAVKPKASASKSKTSSKKKSGNGSELPPGVLKVDGNGNQWIAEFDEAAFKAMKQSFIKAGKYDSSAKNRCHDIYKALGWIL